MSETEFDGMDGERADERPPASEPAPAPDAAGGEPGPVTDHEPPPEPRPPGLEPPPQWGQPIDAWSAPPAGPWAQPPWSGGPSVPEPLPRRGRAALAAVLAGLVLLSGGIGIGLGWSLSRHSGGGSTTVGQVPLRAAPANPSSGQADTGLNVQAIANRVDPAVVDINTSIADPLGARVQGAGTGMVVTSSGQVLTNNHVIAGATSIRVTIAGHSGTYAAQVVGADPADDVALLQIQGVSGLPTVTLADSSNLSVGQEVVAIGNALGQGGTPSVTDGTISGLGRSINVADDRGGSEHLTGLIQTDAPIQPGDSGGPLVNSAGQVVGMLTAAARGSFGQPASRVGFAIPTGTALGIVNQIRAGHSSSDIILGQTGFLGVVVRDMDGAAAAQLGLGVTSGALVVGVNPGSPAAGAGIRQDAVITEIDGHKIASTTELGSTLHQHKPGDQVRVTWVDRTGTHTATVSLTTGPAV